MKNFKFTRSTVLYVLLILAPVLLVFRNFFQAGPLVWGDAPYLYPEGLKELIAEPSAWISRGNNFGGINYIVWLSPLMFLYGLFHTFLNLGNDIIIRILFYFPATILAAIGPILLARYLKLSKTVQFFASFVYILNTYFLLLIDGGQVGIALAYGIFPLALLFLRKLIDAPNFKIFYSSLAVTFLLTIADPRIAIILILTLILWVLIEKLLEPKSKKVFNLKYLILTAMALIGLCSYWLVPLFRLSGNALNMGIAGQQFSSLMNPLLLFSPHWPGNVFGKIVPPAFYFVGVPFLIFGGFLIKSKKKNLVYIILFLIFAFLIKGSTPPLGGLYSWVIENIFFASAFRDSSKFFIPLLLFAGILIGKTVEKLKNKWVFIGAYIYLLFLILPALSGNLNFILSNRIHSPDLKIIHSELKEKDGFFRTAWFPEKHPLTFHAEEKPALDAKSLINNHPFAFMNTGTDPFNFMHNDEFPEWFRLLGIRYLAFPGDTRNISLNEDEQKSWNDFLSHIVTIKGLAKVDWNTDIPVYEISETRPRLFGVNKLVAVVGPPVTSPQIPAVYFEDGKLDPANLEGIASESAVLVFNDKEEVDLTMSLLQEYFVGINEAEHVDWAYYESDKYLDWKYQLLIREIDTKEFDYGKGIAFSTEPEEKITFETKTLEGKYILAIRSMTENKDNSLTLELNGEREEIRHSKESQFEWFVKPVSFEKGKQDIILENPGGLQVLNTVALIPEKEWISAQNMTTTFVEHFGTSDSLENLKQSYEEIEFEKTSPTRYKMILSEDYYWVVFTDNFHPSWILKRDQLQYKSLPFYSMVNGFYKRPEWNNAEIVFEGQKEVRWGMYYSAVSFLVLTIIFLWFYPSTQKRKK